MKSKYVVDKDFSLRKVTHSVWEILWSCAKCDSLSCSVLLSDFFAGDQY